jgi:BA14K-like protein
MKVLKLAPIGLLALLALGSGAAQAGPAAGAAQAAAAAKVEAGIVGGIIANEIYRPRYRYYDDYSYDGPYYAPSGYGGDARELCAQNFRSFEWRTGLYTTYEGDKRLCPYLR